MISNIGGCNPLPEWDILSEVLRTRDNIELKAEWIQSHQDDKTPFYRLEFKIQLNILSDKEAANQHKSFHRSI